LKNFTAVKYGIVLKGRKIFERCQGLLKRFILFGKQSYAHSFIEKSTDELSVAKDDAMAA